MRVDIIDKKGSTDSIKLGYSWTTLFFSYFVPLFRGDLEWAAILFLLNTFLEYYYPHIANPAIAGLTLNTVAVVFSFIYNRLYAKKLMKQGFDGVTSDDKEVLRNYNIRR